MNILSPFPPHRFPDASKFVIHPLLLLIGMILSSGPNRALAAEPESIQELTGAASGIGRLKPALAVDGRTMALVNPAGAVGVYALDETTQSWRRDAVAFIGISPRASVSLAGDLLVVGHPEEGREDLPLPAGAVYLYERDRGGPEKWGELMVLEDWNARTMDFGKAVSTDGETIAVRHSAGVVLFGKRPDSHGRVRWLEEGRVLADNHTSDVNVQVSGDHLVIFGGGSTLTLYRRILLGGVRQWIPAGSFYTGSQCLAVTLHGDTLAFSWRSGSTAPATVQTTEFDRANLQWSSPRTLSFPDVSQPFSYGAALSLFGHTLAVGAGEANSGNGGVYLFRRYAGAPAFEALSTLHSERTDAEGFGQRLALAEGLLVVLGPQALQGSSIVGAAHGSYLAPGRPVIARHPHSIEGAAGEGFQLDVRAAGPSPLQFRWFKNAQLVQESVSPVLTVTAAEAPDAGRYQVEVVAPTGQVWSSEAIVAVHTDAPAVSAPPPIYAAAGNLLRLAPSISGGPPLSFQWHKDGEALPGADEAVLLLADPDAADSGAYGLHVANPAGEAWSGETPVLIGSGPPAILRQTGDQNVKEGEPVLMFAEVHGSGLLTYQWSRNGAPIPGATGNTLFVASPQAGVDNGLYRVAISNALGVATSRTMNLVIRPPAPLPIAAGGHTQVSGSGIVYDLYLPPGYTSSGDPLPILLTFAPGGGGMVHHFKSAAATLQIIVVGVNKSKNGTGWRDYYDYVYLLERELRERVNFDPTRLFAAGFSGGGWASFDYAKARHAHVAGVFSMEGWMGDQYSPQDRYQDNLLVARSYSAIEDHYTRYRDAKYLFPTGAMIRDWVHAGGHIAAPVDVQLKALRWLLGQRDATATDTREAALVQAAEWRAQVSAGRVDRVITECLATLMEQPRTWAANHARVIMGEAFSTVHPDSRVRPNIPRTGGDLAMDYLFFYAYGAQLAGQPMRAWNALNILAGLTDSSHDREADVTALSEKLPAYWPPAQSFAEWSEDRLANVAPELREPASDASQDGIANFAVFGLGLDPTQDNFAKAQPTLEVIEADDQRQLNLLFRQASSATGLQHRIEVSTDLDQWFPIDFQPRVVRIQGTTIEVRATVPFPSDKSLFFKHRMISSQ